MSHFTDTHVHLADPQLASQLNAVLQQAEAAGVHRFIVPSAEQSDWPAVAALNAPNIRPAFGIHPWFADTADKQSFTQLADWLAEYPHALVGETGLDYLRSRDETERERQRQTFSGHIRLAAEFGRPLILHHVGAAQDTVRLLKEAKFRYGGFAHAFSGSLEEARAFTRLGFKIGIGSLLLNPNAKKIRRAAAELPPQDIVLETDSPFMLKNAVNTPENIRKIAEITAALHGITLKELAGQTEQNVTAVLAF
ncbi:MAG: TatD family hydrolase [Neisseria sp.]|nr:TatD family hydrolase [Neisseria sp.]